MEETPSRTPRETCRICCFVPTLNYSNLALFNSCPQERNKGQTIFSILLWPIRIASTNWLKLINQERPHQKWRRNRIWRSMLHYFCWSLWAPARQLSCKEKQGPCIVRLPDIFVSHEWGFGYSNFEDAKEHGVNSTTIHCCCSNYRHHVGGIHVPTNGIYLDALMTCAKSLGTITVVAPGSTRSPVMTVSICLQ